MALDPENDLLWAMPVPPGQVRTAVNPPSSAHGAMATGIATTVVAFLSVVVRIFTRAVVVKGLGIDDGRLFENILIGMSLIYCSSGCDINDSCLDFCRYCFEMYVNSP